MESTPTSSKVLVVRDEPIARVTLNDPARRNPLGNKVALTLIAELRALDTDPDVRVIVLTGAAPAFSAGGDLDEFLIEVESSATEIWENGEVWQQLYGLIPRLS